LIGDGKDFGLLRADNWVDATLVLLLQPIAAQSLANLRKAKT
jgi:hypothetical protein